MPKFTNNSVVVSSSNNNNIIASKMSITIYNITYYYMAAAGKLVKLKSLKQMKQISEIVSSDSLFTAEECTQWLANLLVNPRTGRKIKFDGTTFQRYVDSCVSHGMDTDELKRVIDETKKELLTALELECNGMTDPVSLEDFSDMNPTELQHVIRVGT